MKNKKIITLYSLHGFDDTAKQMRKDFNIGRTKMHELSFQKRLFIDKFDEQRGKL